MKRIFAIVRYLLFLSILVFLYLFNNHALTLLLLIVGLLIPIASFVAFFISIHKVRFGISFRDSAVNREEETAVLLKAVNASLIPQLKANFRFTISNELNPNDIEHIWELYIGPKESMKFEVPLQLMNSGSYKATLLDVCLSDVLGILSNTIRVNETAEAVVLPKEFAIDESVFMEYVGTVTEDAIHERFAKGNDPSEIFEIRNYRSGDRPQQIHWKLSAKEQELMVKEFSDMTGETFAIYLCQDFHDNKQMDAYYDVMYSAGLQLCRMGVAFSYCFIPASQDGLTQVSVTSADKVGECLLTMFYVKPRVNGLTELTAVSEAAGMRNLLVLTTQPFAKKEQSKELLNKDNLARLFLL
ncbi:MAG: DUF58 domain-containing protein [Lachnospiraceae bacterium]|nr:DUF58 domain-containing protein [Lachnospiraceae bacterium]